MLRRMFSVFGVFTVTMMLAFCGVTAPVESPDMPGGLWMTVPANLEGASGTAPMVVSTNNGPAYQHIKSYVSAAKYIVGIGDEIVTALRNHWTFMLANKGTLVEIPAGGWVYMNDQLGGGYYLFYGTNLAVTNIYFDWLNVSGLYKGKIVLFLKGTNETPMEGVAYYDQTTPQRDLDIYAKYDGGSDNKITNIRVLITELSPGEIQIQAMAEYNRDFPMAWNLSAYGKISSAGGAIALATGDSNYMAYTGTNYRYYEFFDGLGYTTWKTGKWDVYSNNALLWADWPDSANTYTNGTKPANIEGIVTNIELLLNCDYPTNLTF
ncbi:MAG: hypothetical protein A2Y33_09115 [Spirochaetes bacterium GWF1_51_8]|nr:MAG: hypothetical protein A2Y33_09115 [Spirochaetes bacterium GWF1_51_8]